MDLHPLLQGEGLFFGAEQTARIDPHKYLRRNEGQQGNILVAMHRSAKCFFS